MHQVNVPLCKTSLTTTHGIVPASIPKPALDFPPDNRRITLEQSWANFARLRHQCQLDNDQLTNVSVTNVSATNVPTCSKTASVAVLAQQECDFCEAIQPGSPIAVLLKCVFWSNS